MKLIQKNTESLINRRVDITRKEIPVLDSSWHYHKEYELLLITKSTGIRFVGDRVSRFYPGDLTLVGPYLPHLWRNDPDYYSEDETNKVKTIIVKFTRDFIGEQTMNNPEFKNIRALLEYSRSGVTFGMHTSEALHEEIVGLIDQSPSQQVIRLLDILDRLSGSKERLMLSTTDMRQFTSDQSQRLDSVIKFISDRYSEDIGLDDVATVACMTTNSFCRFFKNKTNKSFTRFLNEVRIRNATRILVQEDHPVAEVSSMVGYQSITNFNRQFKMIMGTTPQCYRESV